MTTPINVLIVDDNPFDRGLVRDSLLNGLSSFELIEAENLDKFKRALSQKPIDVVVTDYNILSNDGLQISDYVLSNYPQIPVIMLTGTGSEIVAVEALKKGVSDYVVKTTEHIKRLPVTIRKALAVAQLRKDKEEAILKEINAKKFWERIFNTIPDSIIVMDLDMRIIRANRAGSDLFPDADPVGKLCFDVFCDSSQPCSQCPVIQTIEDNKEHDAIIYQSLLDKTFHVSSSFMQDPETDEPVIIYVAKDITEHEKLETLLNQKHKMEAVGRLAGGMAHNFNNLLSVILGNLDLIKLRLKTEKDSLPIVEFEKMLSNVAVAGKRARDLIAQIMIYSRTGSEERKSFNVTGVVTETVRLLRSFLPSTIALSYTNAKDVENLTVEANETQLQEALLNICSNASDAMDEQGTLDITVGRSSLTAADIPPQYECKPGTFVKISIADSGCGMSKDLLDKIFDPFFTTKGVGEGTGMGLSTVQGMLIKNGGFVKVSSVPGEGSTFDLFLPCSQLEPLPETEEVASVRTGNENILLVDDQPELRVMAEQMLGALGYNATVVTSGCEALRLFSLDPDAYDLIMTDQTMPEMTGKELAVEILKIRPNIPIILCTGFSSKIDAEAAQKLGIKSFLMKPYDFSSLSGELRKCLGTA